jgi:hypothetical protein
MGFVSIVLQTEVYHNEVFIRSKYRENTINFMARRYLIGGEISGKS